MLLRNVRPFGGPARDLLVGDARIVEAGQGLPAREGMPVLDGRGQLALPGLVEAHAHLDKTLWGLPWRPHSAGEGGLAALIENEHRGRSELARSGVTVAERAGNLLGAYAAAGTAHIRSHVDVDTVAGLDSLHGVMEARAAFAGRVSVELVAFPQSGLLVRPGTLQLLEEACGPAPSWSAGSTRPASTIARSSTWTRSSPSPTGTAAASTFTSTTAASWAPSPST